MKSTIHEHQKNNFTIVSKTIKHFSLALVVALITTLSSCSSDSSGGGGAPATGNFVKSKVGGSNFSSDSSITMGNLASGNLVLQGATTAGKTILIQLYAFDGTLETGTYDVSASQTNSTYTGSLAYTEVNTSTATSTTYESAICNATGTIKITYVGTDKVEGTFSFTGKELRDGDDCSGGSKNVTNGTFRLEL